MRYTVLCVGKLREKFYAEAVREYEKRLSRYAKVNIVEVPDEKAPERAPEALQEQIRSREGERLLRHIREEMYVIALDLRGKEYDSVAFAGHLADKMVQGHSHIAFIIGGSLGLHDTVLRRATESVSFSRLTFPHALMRVILLEQVYRACRIQNGEPYHK